MHFYGTVSASLAKYLCNSRQGAERRACWRTGEREGEIFFVNGDTVFAALTGVGETALHADDWMKYAISYGRRESSSGMEIRNRVALLTTCAWDYEPVYPLSCSDTPDTAIGILLSPKYRPPSYNCDASISLRKSTQHTARQERKTILSRVFIPYFEHCLSATIQPVMTKMERREPLSFCF